MEIIVLGSGTSQGVPLIGCVCPVCVSSDPRNRRTRASVHVVMDGLHIQVDAAPEFRLQCLREGIVRLDHFILTHGHADHIAGMDDLRRFCDMIGGAALPVFSTPDGLARVREVYPYAIREHAAVKGYPALSLREMPPLIDLPQGTIASTLLPHGRIGTLGLVFTERSSGRRFAYYTDCKTVPPGAVALAAGADALVLDGLRPEPHPTHLSIPEALDIAREIGAARTWLTHLTHLSEHEALGRELPRGLAPAHDGLRILMT